MLVALAVASEDKCNLYVSHSGNDSNVCGNSVSPCLTIQQAVWNAAEGDVVCVIADSPYNCPGDGEGVYARCYLLCPSAVINCAGQGRAFWFDGTNSTRNSQPMYVHLQGFYFTNANAILAGAIYGRNVLLDVSGSANVGNENSNYLTGGAIFLEYFEDIIGFENNFTNTSFQNNSGGAVCICYYSSSYDNVHNFNGVMFSNNNADYAGAIQIFQFKLYQEYTQFYQHNFNGNTASVDGGAVYLLYMSGGNDNTHNFIDAEFNNNVAVDYGGAVYLEYDGSGNDNTHNFISTTFNNNSAFSGGAVMIFYQNSASNNTHTFNNVTAISNQGPFGNYYLQFIHC